MQKEALTIENVKKDLYKVVAHQLSIADEWRFIFILSSVFLSVLAGIFFKSIPIALLLLLPGVYHLILYIKAVKKYREEKNALLSDLERGDFAISEEIFDHTAKEQIYEPHTSKVGARTDIHYTRTITLYHFKAGGSWRPPNDIQKHYDWSPEFYLSPTGLENISVDGNLFYRISLQGRFDISYIYPAKFFTLGEDLKKATEKAGGSND